MEVIFQIFIIYISCSVPVLMLRPPGVQVAGRFTMADTFLVLGTQIAFYLVINATTAAVATITFASSTWQAVS
jgi:hypothetical protein